MYVCFSFIFLSLVYTISRDEATLADSWTFFFVIHSWPLWQMMERCYLIDCVRYRNHGSSWMFCLGLKDRKFRSCSFLILPICYYYVVVATCELNQARFVSFFRYAVVFYHVRMITIYLSTASRYGRMITMSTHLRKLLNAYFLLVILSVEDRCWFIDHGKIIRILSWLRRHMNLLHRLRSLRSFLRSLFITWIWKRWTTA